MSGIPLSAGRGGSEHGSRGRPGFACALAIAVLATLLLPARASAATTWLSPVPISALAHYTAPTDLAVAPDGTVIAAWIRYTDASLTTSVAEVAVRPPGAGFGAAQTLSSPTSTVDWAQVAVDESGDAIVVWDEVVGGFQIIRAALKAPGTGAFGAPQDVSGTGRDASSPAVAISNNTAIATWSRNDGSNTIVQAAVKQAASAFFGSAGDLSLPGQSAWSPAIAMDAAGNAVAAWQRRNASGLDVLQAAARLAGGSFAALADVFTEPASNDYFVGPKIVLDGATGRATLVWAHWSALPVGHTIEAAARGIAGNFGAVDDVSDPAVGVGGLFDVAVDQENTAVAVWNGPTQMWQASVRPSGGSFGAIQDISGPGTVSGYPSVAVDPSGDAIAVWQGADGSNPAIQSVRRPKGGQFGGLSNIRIVDPAANEGLEGRTPLGIDSEGNAATMWMHTFDTDPGAGTAIRSQVEVAGLDAAPPQLSGVVMPGGGTAGQPVSMAASAFDRWSSSSISWSFGDGTGANGDSVAHAYGAQGTYTVTVTATDAVGNAASAQRMIQVGPTPPAPISAPSAVPDRDGDGFNASVDCDDGNAAIRPGAREIAGNAVDENCDGVRAPLARVNAAVENTWNVRGSRIRALRLRVIRVPAGATIRVSCKGRGCPFKKAKTVRVTRAGAVDLLKTLKGANRRFRAGQTLEIRITAPNRIGKVISFRFKTRKIPTGTTACLAPGATRPTRC